MQKQAYAGLKTGIKGRLKKNFQTALFYIFITRDLCKAPKNPLNTHLHPTPCGAVVGEIVGEALLDGREPETLNAKEQEQLVNVSKLIASTVVGVTGGDVNAAAQTAQTAVEKNALSEVHYQAELDALWHDSKGDKEKYYQGVQQIAERDGVALDILLNIFPAVKAGQATVSYTFTLCNC